MTTKQADSLPRTLGEVQSRRCPRCGSTLITNGRVVWCTFVGGGTERPCTYGIDKQEPFGEMQNDC